MSKIVEVRIRPAGSEVEDLVAETEANIRAADAGTFYAKQAAEDAKRTRIFVVRSIYRAIREGKIDKQTEQRFREEINRLMRITQIQEGR